VSGIVQAALLGAAAASPVLLAIGLLRERRLRVRSAALDVREQRLNRIEAGLKLLQSRAATLREDIALLEEQRDALVVVIPESARSERLRKDLARRVHTARTGVRLPVVATR
jgi:hypothetical protein